jgi:hypothetical protein
MAVIIDGTKGINKVQAGCVTSESLADSINLPGLPTAATAPVGTNNKQLATTEFAHGIFSTNVNGYQVLPSGLIIQWGISPDISGETGCTITFPIVFPKACLNASTTVLIRAANSHNDFWGQVYAVSSSSMGVFLQSSSSNTADTTYPVNIYWLALGF